MSDFAIETQRLSYSFGSLPVLRDVSLQVPPGAIYGFLGPNGAGKTTTIRLLLGLLHQRTDHIFLFGASLKRDRMTILGRTGALIEEPSLYRHLTAWENLRATALLRKASRSRITEVLDITGLEKDAGRRVKAFSLGMKQRLGLAIALLSEPELLILDEPTNGLDPGGIADIREVLIRLNREKGITVFLSSHLLDEVEKLATHIGILYQGRLLYQGPADDLTRVQAGGPLLRIETNDTGKAETILQPYGASLHTEGHGLQLPYQSEKQTAEMIRLLVAAGLDIYRVMPQEHSLESLFLALTTTKNQSI